MARFLGRKLTRVDDWTLLHILWMVAVLTLLVSVTEVRTKSKAGFGSCFTFAFVLHVVIFDVGNFAAAWAGTFVLRDKLSPLLAASPGDILLAAFAYAFIGVFAFSFIISRMNVTFLDKGVLTIEDWTGKAAKPEAV
jgi:hypothetical protein